VPVMVVWLISQLSPMYHHRFFLFFSLGLYLIIAQIIDTFLNHNFKFKTIGIFLLICFYILLGSSFVYLKHNPVDDLYNSQVFMKTQINQSDNIMIIHTATFSQTPYKYYFRDYPNIKQMLITNMDVKARFTAGGSVIKDNELLNETDLPQHFYYLSDSLNPISDNENVTLIYDKEGLLIWKK